MQPANTFELKGSGVEVNYKIGALPQYTEVTYTDGAFERSFGSDQILANDTSLGELVSVPLIVSVDTGGQRFGFFLPLIEIADPRNQRIHFRTVGIYETFSGPDSVPHRRSTWRCIEMTGTAQALVQPL